MTVITLASIGCGETHPLSDAGRVFTIFLILGGMTAVSNGALTITTLIVDGELMQSLKRRRMDKAGTIQNTRHAEKNSSATSAKSGTRMGSA